MILLEMRGGILVAHRIKGWVIIDIVSFLIGWSWVRG